MKRTLLRPFPTTVPSTIDSSSCGHQREVLQSYFPQCSALPVAVIGLYESDASALFLSRDFLLASIFGSPSVSGANLVELPRLSPEQVPTLAEKYLSFL